MSILRQLFETVTTAALWKNVNEKGSGQISGTYLVQLSLLLPQVRLTIVMQPAPARLLF